MTIIKPQKIHPTTIASKSALCVTLGFTLLELNEVLSVPSSERYKRKEIDKPDGSKRVVYNPHPLIRRAQRRINTNIFKKLVSWPYYLYGSIPNTVIKESGLPKIIIRKDYVTCASKHCGAKSLLKMDIKNFFDNIHENHVRNLFLRFFHFSPEVAHILTNICCHESNVVQGSPTSSYIASLILWDVEHLAVKKISRKNLVYTRLVDDISVSSKSSKYDFSMIEDIITQMLTSRDLPVNKKKTKHCYLSTEPLTVHGIRINYKEPRFPSDEIRRLRSYVHNLQTLAKQPGYRTTHSYRTDYAICMGKVNKLKRVNHNKHFIFLEQLRAIRPLPSEDDLDRCRYVIARLDAYNTIHGNESFSYRKRFYRLQERLNVLQRLSKYKTAAKEMRARLKSLRPPNEV
ncbi:reverse transcriptase family protein [Vibrio fluvialis]|nr:reverse transcriptase family protein [Vibrio fluvialis]